MKLLLTPGSLWPTLLADITTAASRVYVQTLGFEADPAGLALAAALQASSARHRRIVVDAPPPSATLTPARLATEMMIDELVGEGVPVGGAAATGPFSRRSHKQLVVIDDRVAYIGGSGFALTGRDLMLRVPDPLAVRFLADDFERTWAGRPGIGSWRGPNLELHTFDGATHLARLARVLRMVRSARKSLYVECPSLSPPLSDWLAAAARRGVEVTAVLPGRATRLAALLVDGRTLMVGSADFDFWSPRFRQELVAVTSDRSVVETFRDRVAVEGVRLGAPVRKGFRWAPVAGRLRRLRTHVTVAESVTSALIAVPGLR